MRIFAADRSVRAGFLGSMRKMESAVLRPRLSATSDELVTFRECAAYDKKQSRNRASVKIPVGSPIFRRHVERRPIYGAFSRACFQSTSGSLFEVTARQKIHPFQYLMVGAALCPFICCFSRSPSFRLCHSDLIARVAPTVLITGVADFSWRRARRYRSAQGWPAFAIFLRYLTRDNRRR